MPPKGSKKSPTKSKKKGMIVTKDDAINWIKEKYASLKTQKQYIDNITKICNHFENDNLDELLGNPEPFLQKLKLMTYSRDDMKLVSSESIKTYLILIRTLTKDNKIASVTEDKQKIYNNEMKKYAKLTEHDRGKNEKKGNLAENPEVTWDFILKKRAEFEKSKYMTSDNLRFLTLISLTTLIRPRRLDARHIKVYHKLPKDPSPLDSYVLLGKGKEVKICYGEFKTRMRMGKEYMKPFKRTLPSELASLIRNYVKKEDLKDGDYLFFNVSKTEQYSDSSFSKQLAKASFKVLGVKLTANDYRHSYMDFLTDHFKEFNDNDLKQIALEMGDLNVYTALKYRFANKTKEKENVTQINERLVEQREQKANQLIHDEEEGSRAIHQEEENESVGTPEDNPEIVINLNNDFPNNLQKAYEMYAEKQFELEALKRHIEALLKKN